jgi:hypothetical protein
MFKFASLATLVLVDQTVARRYLDDRHIGNLATNQEYTEATGEVYSPIVEASDCTSMCLFSDQHNSFCFKFQSPVLKSGWEWSQTKTSAPDSWQI